MAITYDQRRPEIDDIIAIYQSSGIKRPVQDTDRIREMYRHANLVITAWDGEKPVGIARALTDFSYCCYRPIWPCAPNTSTKVSASA